MSKVVCLSKRFWHNLSIIFAYLIIHITHNNHPSLTSHFINSDCFLHKQSGKFFPLLLLAVVLPNPNFSLKSSIFRVEKGQQAISMISQDYKWLSYIFSLKKVKNSFCLCCVLSLCTPAFFHFGLCHFKKHSEKERREKQTRGRASQVSFYFFLLQNPKKILLILKKADTINHYVCGCPILFFFLQKITSCDKITTFPFSP